MTNALFLILTCGAINWGYVYPLAFLLIVLLQQKLCNEKIYLNFLYSIGFWMLLFACISFVAIGKRDVIALYHYGLLPAIAYMIGWCASEKRNEKIIRDHILALVAGFGVYATLNCIVNNGTDRYMLIDFWTGSYRAATGSGILNTMIVSIIIYILFFEKRKVVKLLLLCLFLSSLQYMFILGTRTQFIIFIITGVFGGLMLFYQKDGIIGLLKACGGIAIIALCIFLIYRSNVFSIQDIIADTNLAKRFSNKLSLERSDAFRIQSLWVGLKELFIYPFGGRAQQSYRHNMWLDVGRVSGIIPFSFLFAYSINCIKNVWIIFKKRQYGTDLRNLLLLLYMGVYINFCVEPIWEGQLNFFLAVCVIDGMVNEIARRPTNEPCTRKITANTPNIYPDM